MSKGRLIVLEGLDGSGKSTQLELAENVLKNMGLKYRVISFPNYSSPSGQIITSYLKGEIACDGMNGAYSASSFYAVDRYISFVSDWKKDYDDGAVILCGRYTSSNAIYQMTKLDKSEYDEYLAWLHDYEHKKLGLPEADLVLFLDMPLEISQRLLTKRYEGDESKKDIHESSIAFLRSCYESAVYAGKQYGWKFISCGKDNEARSISDIHSDVSVVIKEMVSDGRA